VIRNHIRIPYSFEALREELPFIGSPYQLRQNLVRTLEDKKMTFARLEILLGVGDFISDIFTKLQWVIHICLAVPDMDLDQNVLQPKIPRTKYCVLLIMF
jgi:hypothetical protein